MCNIHIYVHTYTCVQMGIYNNTYKPFPKVSETATCANHDNPMIILLISPA